MLEAACSPFTLAADITCSCEPDVDLDELIEMASDAIAIMTGGMISGICEDTVIPRSMGRGGYCSCWRMGAYGYGIGMSCQCGPLSGITLRGPNPEVTSIIMHGEPFTDFAIVDDRLLVRTDGRGWPSCQSVTNPSLIIEYTYGRLPMMAVKAAQELVCWFITNPPQSKQTTPPGTRGMNIAGVQITLDTIIQETKRKTLLLPWTSRLLTIYGGPQPAVVYSPELEDEWQLHRVR